MTALNGSTTRMAMATALLVMITQVHEVYLMSLLVIISADQL